MNSNIRRTMYRRLAILALIAIVLIASAGGLYAYRQSQKRADFAQMREQGLNDFRAGRIADAIPALRSYLQRDPNDREVLVAFIDSLLDPQAGDETNTRDAISALRHLMTFGDTRADRPDQLLNLYVENGYATEALLLADDRLKAMPDHIPAIRARAIALAQLRRSNDAIKAAQKWTVAEPKSPEAHIVLLQCLRLNNASPEALSEAIRPLEEAQPDARSTLIVSGIAKAMGGQGQQGADLLRRAVAGDADLATLRLAMPHFGAMGLHVESVAILDRVASAPDAKPNERTLLINRLWEQERWTDLLATMDRLQIKPTSQTLIAMQTWALSRTGRQDEAIKAVAALWTAPGNSAEAWIAAMRISGVLPDRMDPREAIKTFTIATPQTRGYLAGFEADAWALLGETSVAVDRWDRAAGDVPTWVTPIIRLAEYRARSGEIDTALDLAKQAFGRSPRRAVGTLLNTWAGAIEVGESQDIPTLRSLLDELIRTNPDQPELLAIRMAILAADNQQGAAIEAGKQLLALPKERLTGSVILRIAGVSAIRKLGLEQIALDRYKADFGMTLAYADVAASITALAKAPADGLALVREMIASPEHVTAPLEGQSQADVARAWRFLEARWAEVARDPGAGQLWIALADSMPDDVGTQRTALDMVSTRTDTDFQTRAIERLRSLTGEQATAWKLATARSLVAKGNLDSSTLDRAAALLEAVVSSSPKSVEAQFLLARVREASGSTAKAQEHYRAASRLAPDNLLIQVALARLLQTRGDFSGAGLVLDRVLDLREVDAQQARLVAGVLAAQGDSNRAIDLLRDNATGASSDDEMLLAALYRRQGDLERAIAICQRIADGPDNNLGVLTLAADCYAAMGKMDQANAVLDRVSSLKLDPGIPELARAEFAAKHRSATEALEWSRKAVEAGSANENAWRSLLAQLVMAGQGQELKGAIERATQAVPESKAIAEIRKQADMLASATSDSRRRDLAIAFVTNATDPAVRDQLESASRLSAGNTTTYYSTSSLARLRQVADRYPLSMPVQLNMLRQYAAANRLADAASIAARAVESFPTSAEIAELALRAHALSGQWSQVAHYADALRRRAPARSIEADSWAATAALRTGDPQRAVVLLDPHKKEFLVKPDAHADSITLYATVLVAANRPDDARQWISTLLKASQPTRARWLATASSDFPTAFAIDQVELIAAMPDNADLVNAEVATAFHRLASRTKDQSLESRSKEVRDRTAQVAATAPAMLVLAGLASDQSEPQMAIGLYRKVLATVDDDNELAQVAKNNLAMLLLTENQLPEAHALAASAVARRPSSPDYSDTLGRVLLAMGKPVDATGPFRLAAELDSDRPSRAIPLLEALVATADPAAIKEARTRLTTITPESLSDQERAKLEQVRTALNPPR